MELIIYGVVVLVIAFSLVFAIAVLLHLGHKHRDGLLPYIFYPVLFSIGIATLLSHRNLFMFDELLAGPPPTKHAVVAWSSRIATLLLLLIPLERLGQFALAGRQRASLPTLLMVGFCAYYTGNIVTAALWSAHPSLLKDYFMFAAAGAAALLTSRAEGEAAVRSFRNGVFVFVLAGLAAGAIRPELVMSHNYVGILPGVHIRLAGLNTHANSLGPLAAAFLFCLWHSPYRRRWMTILAWCVGGVALLLTQSKSSYIAFLLGSCSLFYFQAGVSVSKRLLDFRRPHIPVVVIICALGGLTVICVAFMFGGMGDRIARFFDSSAGAELVSLTGRDQIWRIAIQEWYRNPVFGYGLTIFDDAYRLQIRIPYAYHAHNQLYQSLASAGAVGAAGLFLYAAAMLAFTLKTLRASHGLSGALFLLMLSRSFSEVPLALIGFGTEQLMQLLLLIVLAAFWKQRAEALQQSPQIAPAQARALAEVA
ncbi:O-antigen ligase family protein [Rugamonas rubra]|uniref:O-antigen ligase n=1 Tax=Rugamonas rubra TaxID=758825 RepID=A0A1I4KZV1_9BURK|nr:O-antigen ligase family protein [Rugamonas rubra]SFL84305.1 O-antigen ligase [Rugamonas rubra]